MNGKVLFGIFIVASIQYATDASLDEGELVKQLLDTRTYNKNIFPQPATNGSALDVKIGMYFVSLAEINGKEGYMTSSLRLTLTWNDPRFKVNGGKGSIVPRISEASVWKPSIQFINAYDKQPNMEDDKVSIYPETGKVIWNPKVLAKTTCNIDAYYFPFDVQSCVIKIKDRVHTTDELHLSISENNVNMHSYIKSGEWTFISSEVRKSLLNPESKMEPATERLTFRVTFRRNPGNFFVMLVVPLILVSFVSILTFPLPTDSKEKLVLGFVSIISILLLLIDMANVIPPSAIGIPLVTKYAIFVLILNIFAILATILVLQLASRESDMPEMVRNIVLTKLGKYVLISSPESTNSKQGPDTVQENQNHVGQNEEEPQTEAESTILNTLHKKKMQNERNELWRTVAAILDRTLFIVFTLVAVIGMAAYLVNANAADVVTEN